MYQRIFLLATALFVSSLFSSTTDDAAKKLSLELQKEYGKKGKIFVAIGDIVLLPENYPSEFGDYLVGVLNDAMKNSSSFSLIEQDKVTEVFTKTKVLLNKKYDYTILDKLSRVVHGATQIAPQGYLYGQIKDMDTEIKVTLKLVDATSGTTLAIASQKYPSDATSDRLLGKQVRTSAVTLSDKKETDPPVAAAPAPKSSSQTLTFDNYKVEVKGLTRGSDRTITLNLLVTNEEEDTRRFVINAGKTSFYDDEGNQYPAEGASIGKIANGRVNDLWGELPSLVPVKSSVTFLKVSTKITKAKTIQLYLTDKEFIIRDVPIE